MSRDAKLTEVSVVPSKAPRRKAIQREWAKNYDLYLLLIPGIVFFAVFRYIPMAGYIIAFKDYNMFTGLWGSEWAGLAYFREMFHLPNFWKIIQNTIMLNIWSLVFGFPAPILLAILLNEIRLKWFKRVSQSLLYVPHFMSWIILGGIVYNVLSPSYGIVNEVLRKAGLEEIYFMIEPFWWVASYVGSGIWASAGWGTILYLAAMTSIDPALYESAEIDGAGRLKRIIHITIPGIMPTILILLIINIGNLTTIGFEHIFALQNPIVLDISQVISTFIYSYGIVQGNFSITTAVDTVQSLINLILILGANYTVRKMGREGLW
ncbi:ABC transporter permease subunit [Paenibacillus sp. J5C_2022]|uniref:ABC transporter permease n=1 Tax=Paenibacillus sp. J5C2022 TaxID=2977129 RepID=UPI0021D0A8D3|nr:ABC transporter permease subunit [Paenibacillus sp. J5C2022]MCU6707844.1 ABC transporter permease subunit [Paenibacillus sp. J5C2022]